MPSPVLSPLRGEPLARRRLPFSVVAKPTGAACNLDCQYCFFLSKEKLYDVPRQLMDESVLERYVAEYLAASPDGEVTMLWQGGEPTLRGLPFFERLMSLCETYRRPEQHVVHALQTNGTLIDTSWASFLAEHDVLTGVSVDGPPHLHDAYRVNKGGRGTYDMVRRGWDLLAEAGVRLNVLTTVHRANEEHAAEVYTHLRDDLGARYVQLIPIVERAQPPGGVYLQQGREVTERSVTPQGYGRFLREVLDLWLATDVGVVFVQDVDSALSALLGVHPTCVHAPECGANLAMEFNGDVYACDHWVEPRWRLGSVLEQDVADLVASPRFREFALKKSAQLPTRCLTCPVLSLCHGGCPKDRFVLDDEGEEQNYLCEGYRSFFTAAMPHLRTMARLLMSGRPASDVMGAGVHRADAPPPGTRTDPPAGPRTDAADQAGSGAEASR